MIKTLMSIRLRAAFSAMTGSRGKRAGKPSVGKIVLFALVYLYLAVVFVAMFALIASSLAPVMVSSGLDSAYFGLFTVIAFSAVFVLSIFETKSELFDCKDTDLLLSMPIAPSDIVISRSLTVLLYNYLETLAVMVPAIVFYALSSGAVRYVLGAIAVTLLLPLPATALASGIGYVVALVSGRFKRKTLVTTLASLAFLAIYFFGYTKLTEGLDTIFEGNADPINNPFFTFIGRVAGFEPIPMFIFALASMISAYVAWEIISRSFISLVTDNKGASRTEYKARRLKKRGVFSALVAKELGIFFSSAAYILNSAIGAVFTLAVGVIALLNERELAYVSDSITSSIGLKGELFLAPIIISGIAFMGSMNTVSSAALSMEGRRFWIMKSLPISPKQALLAKLMPHLIVTAPPLLIASCMLLPAFCAPIELLPFFIITPQLINLVMALIGLCINVAFPKMDYQNEAQPVKQSLAVFLSMMLNLLVALLAVGFCAFCSIKGEPYLGAYLTPVIFALITTLLFVVLLSPCVEKYKKM